MQFFRDNLKSDFKNVVDFGESAEAGTSSVLKCYFFRETERYEQSPFPWTP